MMGTMDGLRIEFAADDPADLWAGPEAFFTAPKAGRYKVLLGYRWPTDAEAAVLEDRCPACGTEGLYYWPKGQEHACRNPECCWRENGDD